MPMITVWPDNRGWTLSLAGIKEGPFLPRCNLPQPETCLLRGGACCSIILPRPLLELVALLFRSHHVFTCNLTPRLFVGNWAPFPCFITVCRIVKLSFDMDNCLSSIIISRRLAPLLFQVSKMPFQARTHAVICWPDTTIQHITVMQKQSQINKFFGYKTV